MNNKIFTLAEFSPVRDSLRITGKKLVCTNGCFDLLHAGHLQSFINARALGDRLLILLNADISVRDLKTPDRPIIDEKNRAAMLAALEVVDYIIIFSERRCTQLLTEIQPDIYVKSADYTLETLDQTERAAVENNGGSIVFTPLIAGLSTSNIIKKIRRSDPEKIITASFAFIKNERQEILLVRNRYEDRIRWGLPGGGQLRGETLESAAIRETREETGLTIKIDSYVGLIERLGGRIHLHCHQFAAAKTGGELRIDPQEEQVIGAEFFTADKIRKWDEKIMGRAYLARYAENPAAYPRYALLAENEE